jgi:hypothetical protein
MENSFYISVISYWAEEPKTFKERKSTHHSSTLQNNTGFQLRSFGKKFA